jgi:ribonucleoside-diphosphate reductase alpha chain
MEAVAADKEYALRDPATGAEVRKLKARVVFDQMVQAAWECGDPGLVFLDRINLFNPTPQVARMESTNPCVAGDTRVSVMGRGLIPIAELVGKLPRVSTQYGLTHDFRDVTQVVLTGRRRVFKLKTVEGYELRLTADHRVTTEHGDIPASEMRKGDRIRLLEAKLPFIDPDSPEARKGEALGGSFDVSEEIWRSSDELRAGYLRGLFTRVCEIEKQVTGKFSLRISSHSLGMLRDVQSLLLHLGVLSSLLHGVLSGKNELVIDTTSLQRFAEAVGFLVPAQQELLEDALDRGEGGSLPPSFFATFESLTEEGEEDVFDLSEPLTQHFHANGFLVHNCGEQPLLPFESCNLGSLNLASYFLRKGGFDWDAYREDIRAAVRFLDNVIDVNEFPLEESRKITLKNRKIGLGVMGLADLLLMMELPYESSDALYLGERLMSFLDREAKLASEELARARGAFPNWKGSLWQRLGYRPLRNATVSTVAPTGTISIIAGCSSGIEPIFSGIFYRNVLSGERLREVHPAVERALEAHGQGAQDVTEERIAEVLGKAWSPSGQVPVAAHVKMQAAFQRHSDSSVSKTINLPESAGPEEIGTAYRQAYALGCKGITVYRDKSRPTQVLERPGTRDMTPVGNAPACPSC